MQNGSYGEKKKAEKVKPKIRWWLGKSVRKHVINFKKFLITFIYQYDIFLYLQYSFNSNLILTYCTLQKVI